jgi:hypothetical protein
VSSEVEILPSAGLVAKDLAASRSTLALSCFQKTLDGTSGFPKGDSVTFHGADLPFSVPGASDAFLLRLSAVLTMRKGTTEVSVPYYTDAVAFADGQAEISLFDQEFRHLPSAALEHRLAALLQRRAKAAIG